jgi:hypothetical protein
MTTSTEQYEEFADTELWSGHNHDKHHHKGSPMLSSPLAHKIVAMVAGACIVGGGTVVLNDHARLSVMEYSNGKQDLMLDRMESKLDILLERTGPQAKP